MTACTGWSVKDVALHLLGDEAGILSRKRDGFSPATQPIANRGELVALVDGLNAGWLQATRRLSPRLLCDLLRFVGDQVCEYFQSLDPYALGGAVSWAGPEPAPVWLDLAREYTERWHHQQHIRDAVDQPGLKEARYLAPALDAFVRALPRAFRHAPAPDGTLFTLTIAGESGGRWSLHPLLREFAGVALDDGADPGGLDAPLLGRQRQHSLNGISKLPRRSERHPEAARRLRWHVRGGPRHLASGPRIRDDHGNAHRLGLDRDAGQAFLLGNIEGDVGCGVGGRHVADMARKTQRVPNSKLCCLILENKFTALPTARPTRSVWRFFVVRVKFRRLGIRDWRLG